MKKITLMLFALVAMMVLGACSEKETGKEPTTPKQEEQPVKETETVQDEVSKGNIVVVVDGEEKVVEGQTEKVAESEINIPVGFETIERAEGNFFIGTGELDGLEITYSTVKTEQPEVSSLGFAFSNASSKGRQDAIEIPLDDFPALKAKYDVLATSSTDIEHKYTFTKTTEENEVYILSFLIPSETFKEDTESLVYGIAETFEFEKK